MTAAPRRHTTAVTATRVDGGVLHLHYEISPIPTPLLLRRHRHEVEDAALAIDRHGTVRSAGRVTYRTDADGRRVAGLVQVTLADPWIREATLRVLFAPLAATSGLGQILCEATVDISDGNARCTALGSESLDHVT